MKRALCLAGAVVATAIACGETLPASNDLVPGADGGVDGSTAADASGSDASASDDADAGLPLPRKPPVCPLFDCPTEEPVCKDDSCNDQSRDFESTGGVVAAGGTCHLTGSAGGEDSMFRFLPRPAARSNVVVAAKLVALDGDRDILSIAIEGAPDAERFVVRRRSGAYELCERNGATTRCATPLAIALPQTLHLYGVVTSETPPRAVFVLAASDCSVERVLEATAPFPLGDVRGSVGCIDVQPAVCNIEFDDALLLLRPE